MMTERVDPRRGPGVAQVGMWGASNVGGLDVRREGGRRQGSPKRPCFFGCTWRQERHAQQPTSAQRPALSPP